MADFDPKVCNSCGQCCHVPVAGVGVSRAVACTFLEVDRSDDTKTRCMVYRKRFKRALWCLSVAQAYDEGRLPKSCPYVKDDDEYVESMEYVPEHLEYPIKLKLVDMMNKGQYPMKLWSGPMGE